MGNRIEHIGDATLYLGDCLDILPTLDKVDAVITDPIWPNAHSSFAIYGDPEQLATKAFSALPPTNRLLVWLGCGSDPRFLRCVPNQLPFLRSIILRYYMPRPAARCLNTNDIVYAFGVWPSSILGRRVLPGECSAPTIPSLRQDHPAYRNDKHARYLINWWSDEGDIILDPFMGVGTTGVACASLGRQFIGIEIERKYFDIACKRMEQEYAQLKLFPREQQSKAKPPKQLILSELTK